MSASGRRYAKALLESAPDADAGRMLSELEALRDAFQRDPSLRKALENPGISMDEKVALLGALEKGAGVLPAVVRLLVLLVRNHRLGLLPDVVSAFRDLRDASAGILRARLTTARPLAGPELARLSERLAAALKRPVALDSSVRGDLLAGAQLQVGSTVYDGSVSGALRALRSSLVKGSA